MPSTYSPPSENQGKMEGARITTAPGPTRGKQPRKCSSCGKLGHSKSRCWGARPELHPQRGGSARQVPQPNQGHEVSKSASKASMPFRFLDLPGEIRNRIYDEVYGGPYQATATMVTLPPRSDRDEFKLDIPYRPKLHIVSEQIYQETSSARGRNSFDSHLRCQLGPIPPLHSGPKYAQFRSRVTKMTFFGFDNRLMHAVHFPVWVWVGMEQDFPNLQEIHFEWTKTHHRIDLGQFGNAYAQEWHDLLQEGVAQAFLDGQFDDKYDYVHPIDRLKVPFLVKHVNTSRNWKTFFTTTLQWTARYNERGFCQICGSLTNDDSHAHIVKRKVKFLVTEHGPQVVERTAEGELEGLFERLKSRAG
ncbi:hypothetical protein PV11_06224 [Exophiala sideris]|uniref:CCHC-type domain-containing protein n=1 Tax=Exophiala sideris TaxID=1016849 RepID=A0A0D1WTX9_9EURO|nr:hypothetical protein PV11_06224 [Exophiala sideris]